jgi:exonuclease SbcD
MKFLHLADLHIGKSVNGFSMLEEQRNIFAQVVNYIKIKKPQAVLIAGDVYDRSVPGVEAVRLFDDFLTELAGLDIAVMSIAGNHDSPERLNYASRLLAGKNIYFGAGNGNVILADEFGEVNFWLVPFLKLSLSGEHKNYSNISEAFAAHLDLLEVDYNARNVILAHQFFISNNSNDSSGDSKITLPILSDSEINPVGGLDAVDAKIVENFDYAALGHLHRAQHIFNENIRYAGSPLKYSFSEINHQKSVTLVELREKNNMTIEFLPLIPIHNMREIRGKLDALVSGEPSFDYLRVILTDEDEIIDPMGKIRAVYPNAMTLEFETSRTEFDFAEISESSAGDIEKLSPFELFGEFFLEARGFAMSEEQEKIMREILRDEEI